MSKDIGLQLLEVNSKLRVISPSLYKYQLELDSVRLQEEIGLHNRRIIAKELGCKVNQIYNFVKRECQMN